MLLHFFKYLKLLIYTMKTMSDVKKHTSLEQLELVSEELI